MEYVNEFEEVKHIRNTYVQVLVSVIHLEL